MICLVGSDACEVAEMVVCIAKLFEIRKKEGVKSTEKIEEPDNNCHDVIFAPSRGSWKNTKNRCTLCILCNSRGQSRYKRNGLIQ